MLHLLRGKKSEFFTKIALVLITIGFSFFGIESYFVSSTSSAVAKVGDKEVGQDEFRDRFNQYRQRMQQMMGGAADASMFDKPEVKRQMLNQLVDEKVLLSANESLGISVPAEQIRKEIREVPAFQNDGKFDYEQYKNVLISQGRTQASFEDLVRQDIGLKILPVQVGATTLVTDADVDTYLRLRDQRRDFHYVKLDKPAADAGAVSDEEIDAFYKAHGAEFMVPERIALDYVELDAAKLDVNLVPDDSMLKERYEKDKARYVTSEQRQASHILVKVGGNGGPDDQKQALAKAEAIVKDARAGKDFAALAKENSTDLGSKNQGGDLGWLDKGSTDEAFESALFALKKGDISEPVLTSEGYHVIDLRDIRPGKTRSFDEVKPELVKQFAEGERERVYAEKAGKLTDLTYQDPSSLETAAKDLGLTVQKTPLFSRGGGEGIATNPAVAKAAFSDAVLVQNNNSDPIELGPNHMAVVRIAEHKAATPIPLADVRDSVRARILAERASKQAKTRADGLLAELDKGGTLDTLATAQKLKLEEQKGIGRDAATLDSALVKAVFSMSRPQAGKAGYKLIDLGGDSYALVQLDNIIDGDPAKLDAKTREAARSTLVQGASTAISTEFIAALRKGTKIKLSEDKLQDL
jgi:peptidyl-prolyl cis-trans isomerase D